MRNMANKEARKRKKMVKKLRGEVAIYIAIFLMLLAIPVCRVYTQAMLSESNIELEVIKSDVKEQENLNESLKMQISELASLDTIQDVANENGLVYTNGNIVVVTNK
jgi:cell division protein FtsL